MSDLEGLATFYNVWTIKRQIVSRFDNPSICTPWGKEVGQNDLAADTVK